MSPMLLRPLVLACALLSLAACSEGDLLKERSFEWSVRATAFTLAPSSTTTTEVTICPAIRTGTEFGQAFTAYQPGRYTLSVAGLPAGVTALFVEGAAIDIPDPRPVPLGGSWTDQPPYPSADATTDVRFCLQRTLRLQRDATPAAVTPVAPVLRLHLVRQGGRPAVLDMDQRYDLPLSLQLPAADSPPPPTGASCPAGQPLAGRWESLPALPSFNAASNLLGFALVEDRPLLARGTTDGRVRVDEWDGGLWRGQEVGQPGAVESLRVAAGADPASGELRRFVAWQGTDYTLPRDQQSRIFLSERSEVNTPWSSLLSLGFGFQSDIRQLQLLVWRGQAVVAWLRRDELLMLMGRPDPGIRQDLRPPAPPPRNGATREVRLARDPVDDSLVLAIARVDDDGVTRIYTWRLATPEAQWQALPAVDAGPAGGGLAGLAGLALASRGGEPTLAWSYGEVNFGGNARLALTAMRHTSAGWQALGDASTLPDAGRGYAMQPLGLALAPTCSGGVFLAWHEPQQYPRGAVHGAQFAAQGGWDPFGRNALATLPDGTGSFAAVVALESSSSGWPAMAALMARPTGGEAVLVVRRFGP